MLRVPPRATRTDPLLPYPPLFRSADAFRVVQAVDAQQDDLGVAEIGAQRRGGTPHVALGRQEIELVDVDRDREHAGRAEVVAVAAAGSGDGEAEIGRAHV